MAGRIRTIKPEILADERSAALTSDAWRLWVSMWLLADDFGRVRGEPRWLAANIFWACPSRVNIEKTLGELLVVGLVRPYAVRGQVYLLIVNWAKHQRIDNASNRGALPMPEEDDGSYPPQFAAIRGELPRLSAPRGSDLEGKGREEERRGEGVAANAAAAASVLEHLNEARKKSIPGARAITVNKASLEHINARLADGYSVADCLHVISVCAAEVRQKPDTAKWFNTVSPFRKDNFARKLGSDPDSFAATGHARAPTYGAIEEEGDMTHLLGSYGEAKP